MGRACTVCAHASREAIDAALVAGEPNRRVAARYGLSEAAVRRHKRDHLPVALVKAQDALDVTTATDLLGQVRELQERTLAILEQAEGRGKLQVALQAIREARGNLELQAKMVTAALQLEMQQGGPRRVTVADIDAEILRLEAELEHS